MKKLMFAAVTAGVLSFGMAPTVDAAAVRVGIGPAGGVHVKIGNGHHPRWRHKHCQNVKVWRHGHPRWVQKCWWH